MVILFFRITHSSCQDQVWRAWPLLGNVTFKFMLYAGGGGGGWGVGWGGRIIGWLKVCGHWFIFSLVMPFVMQFFIINIICCWYYGGFLSSETMTLIFFYQIFAILQQVISTSSGVVKLNKLSFTKNIVSLKYLFQSKYPFPSGPV